MKRIYYLLLIILTPVLYIPFLIYEGYKIYPLEDCWDEIRILWDFVKNRSVN